MISPKQLGISAIATFLPGSPIDNVAFGLSHDFEETFVRGKLGILSRHEIADHQNVSDMASEALKKVLLAGGISPRDLEVLVLVTQTPDQAIPHTSALVQAICGVSDTCLVFDVSLGCSGYVIGLDLIHAVMERHGFRYGALVTAEAYSRIVDSGDRATGPIFGDAASATLITENPIYRMGRSVFGSDGSGAESLILRGSGSRKEEPEPLFMDGRDIMSFTRKRIPASVHKCLELNQVPFSEVDRFVFHQANEFVVRSLGEQIGVPEAKLVVAVESVGNTTASSIPLALAQKILDSPVQPDIILLSGFGVGLSWASTVLFKED